MLQFTELTGIQDLVISLSEDTSSIKIKCVFFPTTNIQGCNVTAQCEEDNLNAYAVNGTILYKDPNSIFSNEWEYPCDHCLARTLLAYDILNDENASVSARVVQYNITCPSIVATTSFITETPTNSTSQNPPIYVIIIAAITSSLALLTLYILLLVIITYLRDKKRQKSK